MLSEEALKKFKEIWLEEIGEEISDEFAAEQAINLLNIFSAVYRSIKKEWQEQNS